MCAFVGRRLWLSLVATAEFLVTEGAYVLEFQYLLLSCSSVALEDAGTGL